VSRNGSDSRLTRMSFGCKSACQIGREPAAGLRCLESLIGRLSRRLALQRPYTPPEGAGASRMSSILRPSDAIYRAA
jgi:hypothetical protein